jgi:hypothetical protein
LERKGWGAPAQAGALSTRARSQGALNDLQTAQTAANARPKGAATVRNEKRTVLVSLLQQLRGYVQTMGRRDAGERRVEPCKQAVAFAWRLAPSIVRSYICCLGGL